jgi:hypothetical protein
MPYWRIIAPLALTGCLPGFASPAPAQSSPVKWDLAAAIREEVEDDPDIRYFSAE